MLLVEVLCHMYQIPASVELRKQGKHGLQVNMGSIGRAENEIKGREDREGCERQGDDA